VLDKNRVARTFYEHRGWHLDDRRRAAPYPPYPEEVGYTIEL
jgi:hypothetical protein